MNLLALTGFSGSISWMNGRNYRSIGGRRIILTQSILSQDLSSGKQIRSHASESPLALLLVDSARLLAFVLQWP